MKTNLLIIISLVSISILAACAPAAPGVVPAVPTSLASEYLSIAYTDAANLRSQLAYGTLELAGTPNAVTPDQAKALLPLWQAIIALSGDETTASEELTAVQDQITAAMTADQLKAIASMQITNSKLGEFYAEYGLVLPTPIPGVTKVPGSGSGKTEEEKAAMRATVEASGQTAGTGQTAKTMLFEKVVENLSAIAK
jgi:hypothetical protein